MDAEALFLPPGREFRDRVSMTALRHYDACARSGYLYQLHRGEGRSDVMQRGRAVHLALERCTRTMLAEGERSIPGELAKAICDEVLAEEHVPMSEHDYIRECVYRWAHEWRLDADPASVVCEALIALRVGHWTVRCRVDFAQRLSPGVWYVADYKSGRGMPAQEEVARKRPDGSLAAKQFQLIVYALALAYGHEILDDATGEEERRPWAHDASHFILEYVFPGIEDKAGLMARREVALTSLELAEYHDSLEGLLRRLTRSQEYGDWPAIVSDAACNECPATHECPIHRNLRDNRGVVTNYEEAVRAARVHHRLRPQLDRLRNEVKAFAKREKCPVVFDGMEWRFDYQEKVEVTNRDELVEAAEAGTPAVPATRLAKLSPFVCKPKTEEEVSDVPQAPAAESGRESAGRARR